MRSDEPSLRESPTPSLADRLREAAGGSIWLAEAAEVVSAHFTPQLGSCWSEGIPGKGALLAPRRYALLRTYTLDKDDEARAWRLDAEMLIAAADAIGDASEGARKDGSSPNPQPQGKEI